MNTSPEPEAPRPGEPVFYCRNILKCYEAEPVVSGINLDLAAGELISLVGPSGVGKTTLFNVLAGVDSPDGGHIFLDGEDISGVSGNLSYRMQSDLLLEYRTVLDNVILPLLIKGMKKKAAREYASSFFEDFCLAGYEKKYPRQLSGGMRQRAALLRTCLQSAGLSGYTGQEKTVPRKHPVILLDEPFSALDALTRWNMQDWFQNIIKPEKHSPLGGHPLSAVFITHDVEEALILSCRVYVLTGKPGTISAVFEITPPQPRSRDFLLSPEFTEQKRMILEAIGL
jgi:ABC-type nitrate/sulfonate/bicarbonate transport system ATPase subunit